LKVELRSSFSLKNLKMAVCSQVCLSSSFSADSSTYVFRNTKRNTFTEARKDCKDTYKGDLATIKTKEEWSQVKNVCCPGVNGTDAYYIDLEYCPDEQGFKWIDEGSCGRVDELIHPPITSKTCGYVAVDPGLYGDDGFPFAVVIDCDPPRSLNYICEFGTSEEAEATSSIAGVQKTTAPNGIDTTSLFNSSSEITLTDPDENPSSAGTAVLVIILIILLLLLVVFLIKKRDRVVDYIRTKRGTFNRLTLTSSTKRAFSDDLGRRHRAQGSTTTNAVSQEFVVVRHPDDVAGLNNQYEEIGQKQPSPYLENEYESVDDDNHQQLKNINRLDDDSHLYTLKKTKSPSRSGNGFFVGDSFYASMRSSASAESIKSKDSQIEGGFVGNSFYASMSRSSTSMSPKSLKSTSSYDTLSFSDLHTASATEPPTKAEVTFKKKRLSSIDEKYTQVTQSSKRIQSEKALEGQPDTTAASETNYVSVYSTPSRKTHHKPSENNEYVEVYSTKLSMKKMFPSSLNEEEEVCIEDHYQTLSGEELATSEYGQLQFH